MTKASGLAFLAEHLDFTADRTIAFGDGENDVELLEWAGFGIAVANAHSVSSRRPTGCVRPLKWRGRPGGGSPPRL